MQKARTMVKTLVHCIFKCCIVIIYSRIPVGKKKNRWKRKQINKKTKQNTREDDLNQRRKRLKEVKSNLLSLFWQRMKHVGELQMKTKTNKWSDWSHITLH